MKILQNDFFGSIINNIEIEILEHGHLLGDKEWKHYNINSPFNRLYFVLDGEGIVENDKDRMLISAGNAYLIPIYSTYNYSCDSRIEKFYVHFNCNVFSGQDVFNNTHSCLSIPCSKELICKLVKQMNSRNISDVFWCKIFFMDTISRFTQLSLTEVNEQIHTAVKYQDVYRFLKEHQYAGTTITQLAEFMNMSVSNFSKQFRQDTGMNIKEYVQKQLIRIAKEKLLLGNQSIKEIAYSLKFSDEFYFSRFFKKQTGVSPKEYRACNRM